MATEEQIERRALFLQSLGPDEFPFGYYKWLAKKLFEEEAEAKKGGDDALGEH